MRDVVLREVSPGGPCPAAAVASRASGTSDSASVSGAAAYDAPTESRPVAPVRSAGTPDAVVVIAGVRGAQRGGVARTTRGVAGG